MNYRRHLALRCRRFAYERQRGSRRQDPAAVRIVRVFLESGVFLELDRSQLERDER
jgi:hypothetical protein